MKKAVIILAVLFALSACSSGSQNKQSETSSSPPTIESAAPKKVDLGLSNYRKYCSACHQLDANGVPGMYPPLSNSKVIQGDPVELVNIIVNGISGERNVDGLIYNNLMASMAYMTDEEIAHVLTYLRSNFGNEAPPVTVEEVTAARASL